MSESCKRSLQFTVPLLEVEDEAGRVAASIQKKVRLPGFRPGKTPESLIRSRYESDIRSEVVENLVRKHFNERVKQDRLDVVGAPKVSDVHFHKGEPIKFTVDFEVAPEIELGEYRGLTVVYQEPEVTPDDLQQRIEVLRQQKAVYANIDPRPAIAGDHAVVSLKSVAGVSGEPVQSDEMILALGDEETLPEFNQALIGASIGDAMEVTVNYPASYGHTRLAGRKVTFSVALKALRKKELPELDDSFAQEVGDFQTLEELNEELRRQIHREKEAKARQEAQARLIDQIVDSHAFPIPGAYVDRQIEMGLESRMRELALQGIDPRQLKVDWDQLKEKQAPQATKDVKASLLLDKIGEREAIETLAEDVDREVHRLAKQVRQPAAALRMQMEKDGTLGRMASRIRTEKVLNFLFENARKVAG